MAEASTTLFGESNQKLPEEVLEQISHLHHEIKHYVQGGKRSKYFENKIQELEPWLMKIQDQYKDLADNGLAILEGIGISMHHLQPDMQEITRLAKSVQTLDDAFFIHVEPSSTHEVISNVENCVLQNKIRWMNSQLEKEGDKMGKYLSNFKIEEKNYKMQLCKSEEEVEKRLHEHQELEEKIIHQMVLLKSQATASLRDRKTLSQGMSNEEISVVTQQFEEVSELRKEASALWEQLNEYEGLPPDISSARGMLECAKHHVAEQGS